MRKLLTSLWLLVALPPCLAQIPDATAQVLVVTTPEWTNLAGSAQRFERSGRGRFHKVGAPFAIVVGRTGMGWDQRLKDVGPASAPFKHEGDGRAPAGIFPLGAAFGYESSVATHLPYLALNAAIECVDDAKSTQYNQLVDSHVTPKDWNSSEQMRRTDELYHYGVVVAYNQPPVSGAGSCIFLHVWKSADAGTDGCTAMDPAKILLLLSWFDPEKHPLLVQMPRAQYQQMRKPWALPAS